MENNEIVTQISKIHHHYWGKEESKNDVNKKIVIEKDDITDNDIWGLKYYFSLGNAVQNCPEFIVPLPALNEIANKNKLILTYSKQLQNFIVDCTSTSSGLNETFIDLLSVMSVLPHQQKDQRNHHNQASNKSPSDLRKLTEDEWEAIGVYSVLVFEKE